MTIQEAMHKAVEGGYHLNGSAGMDTDDAGANRACSAWTRKETDSTCVGPNIAKLPPGATSFHPHCFIDIFLLLLLRDLHGLTAPWEILSGDNIAENNC
jgi:hypothetical protein